MDAVSGTRRRCQVCAHSDVAKIDRMLITGTPQRHVAAQFNVDRSAVQRHAKKHIPEKLIQSQKARELADADALAVHAQELYTAAVGALVNAQDSGKAREMLAACREARSCLETIAKITGAVTTSNIIDINGPIHVNVDRIQAVIMDALRDHPEARASVAAALVAAADDEETVK